MCPAARAYVDRSKQKELVHGSVNSNPLCISKRMHSYNIYYNAYVVLLLSFIMAENLFSLLSKKGKSVFPDLHVRGYIYGTRTWYVRNC